MHTVGLNYFLSTNTLAYLAKNDNNQFKKILVESRRDGKKKGFESSSG